MKNRDVIDAEVKHERDFSFDFFGFKVCVFHMCVCIVCVCVCVCVCVVCLCVTRGEQNTTKNHVASCPGSAMKDDMPVSVFLRGTFCSDISRYFFESIISDDENEPHVFHLASFHAVSPPALLCCCSPPSLAKTLERAYLLKLGDKVMERPQYMFMRIAIGIHGEDLKVCGTSRGYKLEDLRGGIGGKATTSGKERSPPERGLRSGGCVFSSSMF